MPADNYTPTMDEVREALTMVGTKWHGGALDRALAAHDAELRESVAKEIEAACVWELEDGDGLCGVCADAARIARGELK